MTDKEFQDRLRDLEKLIRRARKAGDMRLNEISLAFPCVCSLSQLYESNPALRDLIAQHPAFSTLTVVTGGFLPNLIVDELHKVQMWVIQVPYLDEVDMRALAATDPTTFRLTSSYISWLAGEFSVTIADDEVSSSLNDAFADDKLIVAFTAGDKFIVRLIPVRDMVFGLQAAGICSEDWDDECEDADAVDSDGDDSDIVTGIYGETSYLLRARYVEDDACPDHG
jgi:hypothetical protein